MVTGFRPDLAVPLRGPPRPGPGAGRRRGSSPTRSTRTTTRCGDVAPHGYRELAQPEQDLYLVGMKSYGRAPSFLAMTGFEQVRSVVAALDGDLEAADRVDLVLPETGVCNGAGAFDDPTTLSPSAAAAAAHPPRPSRSWSPSAAPPVTPGS